MKNLRASVSVAAFAVMGVVVAGLAAGQEAPRVHPLSEHAFGASLSTDRAVYRSGEPIRMTFEVFNYMPTPVRFDFTSGQRYDLVIEDRQGSEVWRWSAGRMFTMALGQETLDPAKPRLTYEAKHTATLEPGRYKIKGLLTDVSRRISATVTVEVQ